MTLNEFKSVLLKLPKSIKVFHGNGAKTADNYVIWHEVGKNSLKAEGGTAESCHIIAVDYYTKSEFSNIPEQLETLFAVNYIAYDDVNIDYENDTKFTHYAWTVQV